jgi:hypothetical protein
MTQSQISAEDFCKGVMEAVHDADFLEKHSHRKAPIAIIAFAKMVVKQIVQPKKVADYFDGMTITVPGTKSDKMYNNPHYHSIVGQNPSG